MSIALDPSIVTEQTDNYVDVEINSDLTRGMTVVDRLQVAENDRNKAVWAPVLKSGRQAKVVWTIDIACWKQALFLSLRSPGAGSGLPSVE
jgi:purine nucleosidase